MVRRRAGSSLVFVGHTRESEEMLDADWPTRHFGGRRSGEFVAGDDEVDGVDGAGGLIGQKGPSPSNEMAQITLATQVGEAWAPFCDTRWPAKTDYRRFLLLIPRADGSIHPFVMPEYPPFR